jgi:POT family proton-dependent oligopeptide transporter
LWHALETAFGVLRPQALSSQIYGLYTGFVYLTPFFGGMLADRLLGRRCRVTRPSHLEHDGNHQHH